MNPHHLDSELALSAAMKDLPALSVIAIDYFHSIAAGDVDNDGDTDIYLNRGITGNDLLLLNDLDGSGQRAFVDEHLNTVLSSDGTLAGHQ